MLRLPTKSVPLAGRFTKKRQCVVERATSVHLTGTYWDGGSKSEYRLVRISDGKVLPLSYSHNPPQFGGTETTVELQPGQVLIRTGTFMGKPATCYIYARVEDMPEVLNAPHLRQQYRFDAGDEPILLDILADHGFDLRGGHLVS